jgi:hypothetical protein
MKIIVCFFNLFCFYPKNKIKKNQHKCIREARVFSGMNLGVKGA